MSALWHQALTAAVDNQLARMRTVPSGTAAAAGTGLRLHPPPAAGRSAAAAGADRNGLIDPNRLRNDGGPWRGAGPPQSGRELLGWAHKHGRDKEVFDLGKAWGFPGRVIDWSADDVADVYATMNIPANGPG